MASIIEGFNPALPSQHRLRVELTHDLTTCQVHFDFDLDGYAYSIYYTTDGSVPTESSAISFPYASRNIGYRTQVKALIVKDSDGTKEYPDPVWTPPEDFINFKFGPYKADRAPCANSDCDIRVFDRQVYAHTSPVNSKDAVVVVYARDTGTICEDVGLFYSTDGSDPDPCPTAGEDDVCGQTTKSCFISADVGQQSLLNALFNYEVVTIRINQPFWLVGRSVWTQQDAGGCIENFCFESHDGDAWHWEDLP